MIEIDFIIWKFIFIFFFEDILSGLVHLRRDKSECTETRRCFTSRKEQNLRMMSLFRIDLNELNFSDVEQIALIIWFLYINSIISCQENGRTGHISPSWSHSSEELN